MDRKVSWRIHYLANQNRAYVNALVKEEGLTHAECNLLAEIYRNEGLSQEDVRKKMRIDKSLITRMTQSMIMKGYVRREMDVRDRRLSCLYLTESAKAKMPYILSTFKKTSMWMLEGLTEKEADTLIMLLDKMCESVKGRVE